MSDTWIKPRHRAFRNFAAAVVAPFMRHNYGIKVQPFAGQGDRPYLILYNHQTTMDQCFMGMAVQGAVYHVATEDIFSGGLVSSLLRYFLAPIPIKKGTLDINAVRSIMKVAKEGGTIAMAPEGNRTFSGRTEYINPAVTKLIRRLRLPIALFRIEGGYGVQPRWSNVNRKGTMTAGVSQVIEPEEYAAMTDDELYEAITTGLYVDEARPTGEYRHKQLAEFIERMVYVCPDCGFAEFESHGDIVRCRSCGREVRYLPDKRLEGVGAEFPFAYAADWYDYQKDYVNSLNEELFTGEPLFRDKARIFNVIVYKRKELITKDAGIALFGDKLGIDFDGEHMDLPFEDISGIAVLGHNRVNIYHHDVVWQLRGDDRFNGLKYVNLYYRWKNIKENDPDGKFLGL